MLIVGYNSQIWCKAFEFISPLLPSLLETTTSTMTVSNFFDLFLEELKEHDKLREYYKYHDDPAKLPFRKAYFCQRLQYVYDKIKSHLSIQGVEDGQCRIWDVGSGYSTTQIFLALNGIPSRGSTLEFYYEHIPQRLSYWEKHKPEPGYPSTLFE